MHLTLLLFIISLTPSGIWACNFYHLGSSPSTIAWDISACHISAVYLIILCLKLHIPATANPLQLFCTYQAISQLCTFAQAVPSSWRASIPTTFSHLTPTHPSRSYYFKKARFPEYPLYNLPPHFSYCIIAIFIHFSLAIAFWWLGLRIEHFYNPSAKLRVWPIVCVQ